MVEKVGRNDPCPCGSGKKYKNCHMLLEKETQAAAKYTASGKRKFKAKVIKLEDKSLSIFSKSATTPQGAGDADALQKLKFRMTKKDFRVKTEEKIEELPFPIPKPEEPFEKPQEREMHLPRSDEPFKPATEDFRKKEK